MRAEDKNTIVVVDDDPLFLHKISAHLSHEGGLYAMQAKSAEELFHALKSGPVDCIVLDYDLGGDSGLKVADEIKATIGDPPPIVMLTGHGSERTVVKAFRSGFSDYVSKRNLDTRELIAAIRNAIAKKDHAEAASAETERLKQQLQIDVLTGLRSVAFAREKFAQLAARPQGTAFAVVAAGLEGFQDVRRSLGHKRADLVIREAARHLQKAAEVDNYCTRFDDGLFVCFIDGEPDVQTIARFCSRLQDKLGFETEIERVQIKTSPLVGAALFPEDGADLDSLVANALSAAGQFQEMADASPEAETPGSAPAAVDPPPSQATGPGIRNLTERRAEPRHRVLKRGQILVPGLNAAIDCTVRELSQSGARLRVDDYFAAPDTFELSVLGAQPMRCPVELRWQNGSDMGVRFMEKPE